MGSLADGREHCDLQHPGADAVRIKDFYMVAGAAHPCVEFSGAKSRIGIFGCTFAGGQRGVEWGVNEAGFGIEIADCVFLAPLTAGGISASNSPYCMFRTPGSATR